MRYFGLARFVRMIYLATRTEPDRVCAATITSRWVGALFAFDPHKTHALVVVLDPSAVW